MLSISSRARRVLPMPASPAMSATVGAVAVPTRLCRRASSAVRPTITGESPGRVTSTRLSVGRATARTDGDSAGGALFAAPGLGLGELVQAEGGPLLGSLLAVAARSAAGPREAVAPSVTLSLLVAVVEDRPGDLVAREHEPRMRLYALPAHRLSDQS